MSSLKLHNIVSFIQVDRIHNAGDYICCQFYGILGSKSIFYQRRKGCGSFLAGSETGPLHSLRKLTHKTIKPLLTQLGVQQENKDTVTEDDVKELMEQGAEDGTFAKSEQAMVDRIFHLSDQIVSALMTPRTQMLWLDLDDSLRHNLKLIREHAQDVFPVGRESLDDFCGILHAKDLLDAALERKTLDLAQYVKKPLFVPRSMETFRLLARFRDTGIHQAMVLDEYGGVIGYITLDDIVNEIIGESLQAVTSEPLQITPRDENSWYVDGLYSIDDFKERFGIEELPDEEHDQYHTLGGFLTSYFGYIPKVAEKKSWQNFTFEVVDMDRARIDKILVTRRPLPHVPEDTPDA